MKLGKDVFLAKVLKCILIVALGFGVYLTEKAYRSKYNPAKFETRRSLDQKSAKFINTRKAPEVDSEQIFEKLQMKTEPLPQYIMEVKPSAYVFKQQKKERDEYEMKFSQTNVTRWQYPDFVRVPLTELGVIFYNGQRFYRQGLTNPPEYENNSTGADTRAAGDLDCKSKASNQNTGDDTGIAPRGLAEKIPTPPVGCCNGVPYNASKRCCCRRASFDKDTKFCCAINGCGDFKIMKRDDPFAIEACRNLEGIVVQEYGYHSEIDKYPNFLGDKNPSRSG